MQKLDKPHVIPAKVTNSSKSTARGHWSRLRIHIKQNYPFRFFVKTWNCRPHRDLAFLQEAKWPLMRLKHSCNKGRFFRTSANWVNASINLTLGYHSGYNYNVVLDNSTVCFLKLWDWGSITKMLTSINRCFLTNPNFRTIFVPYCYKYYVHISLYHKIVFTETVYYHQYVMYFALGCWEFSWMSVHNMYEFLSNVCIIKFRLINS